MTGKLLAQRMAPPGVTVTLGDRDEYQPEHRNIRLTARTARQSDWMALARAAHEAGHAVQHVTMRRSYRVWRSPFVKSPFVPVVMFAATLVAVLCHWHPWHVATVAVAVAMSRVAVVLWIEWEASRIAVMWLRTHGLENRGTAAYLRKLWWSYMMLALGI